MRHRFCFTAALPLTAFVLFMAAVAVAAPATIQNTTEEIDTALGLLPGNYGARATDCRAPYHSFGDGQIIEDYVWDVVVLENDFVRVEVLPGIGRVLRFVNKTTGSNQFYDNPSGFTKNFWGRLGWTCTGGIEFMMPLDEHHGPFYIPWDDGPGNNGKPWLIEDHPVDFPDGVRLTMVLDEDTPELYGGTNSRFRVECTVGLKDDVAAFTVDLTVVNESSQSQRLQFWSNAQVSPGPGNMDYMGANLNQHIVFPPQVDKVYDHNDNGSWNGPGTRTPWEVLDWPVHNGQDISRVETFHQLDLGYQGTFVGNGRQVNFGAVYNLDADEGIAKTFPSQIVPGLNSGLKFWHWGGSGVTGYTSGNTSTVMEIMTGPVTVFQEGADCFFNPHPTGEEHSTFMSPGTTLSWTDTYLTPHGIGDVDFLTERACMNLEFPDEAEPNQPITITAAISPTTVSQSADVELWIGQELVWMAPRAMGPGTSPGPWKEDITVTVPDLPPGLSGVDLAVIDDDGLLSIGSLPLTILPASTTPTATPVVTSTPTPTSTPTATPTPVSTTPSPTPTPTLEPSQVALALEPSVANLAHSAPGGSRNSLEVIVLNARQLKSFDFTIDYDPAAWTINEPSDVELTDFLSAFGAPVLEGEPQVDNESGFVRFSAEALTGPYVSGGNALARITWTARNLPETTVTDLAFASASVDQVSGPQTPLTTGGQYNLCFYADVDCDEGVDIGDVQMVAARWKTTTDDAGYWARVDVNSDGIIDIQDIQMVAARWGSAAPF